MKKLDVFPNFKSPPPPLLILISEYASSYPYTLFFGKLEKIDKCQVFIYYIRYIYPVNCSK